MKKVQVQILGEIDYQKAWDYQEQLFRQIIDFKIGQRNLPKEEQQLHENYFIFCEHPHVYTLGKSGDMQHLLVNERMLEEKGATFYKINRGGDITYHGPGQIVGYPILDLDQFFTDIHKYLRLLEEMIIRMLAEYKIHAGRLEGATGVWLDPDTPTKARKICAMGIRTSRWVTMHGFALNVNSNLDYFNNIIPCGISDKQVASMHKELGREIDLQEVQQKLLKHFQELFEIDELEVNSSLNISTHISNITKS